MKTHIFKHSQKNYLLGLVVVTNAPWLVASFRQTGFTVREHCDMWRRLSRDDADYCTFTAFLRCYDNDVDKAQRLVQELVDQAFKGVGRSIGWEEIK